MATDVFLQWENNADPANVVSNNIYREATEGPWVTPIAQIGAKQDLYKDTAVADGTWYYRVAAENADGESVDVVTNIDSITLGAPALTVYLEDNFTGAEAILKFREPDTVSLGDTWSRAADRFSVNGAGDAGCNSGQEFIRVAEQVGSAALIADMEIAINFTDVTPAGQQFGMYWQHDPAVSANTPSNLALINVPTSEVVVQHAGVEVARQVASSMIGELKATQVGTTQTVTLNDVSIVISDRSPTGSVPSGLWQGYATNPYDTLISYFKVSAP